MKLKKLGEKTYVLMGDTNIGIYVYDKNSVVIIDTGLTESVGKDIVKLCQEKKWNIEMIINTHSHADHVGGNAYIQSLLGVNIYANKMERIMIENPIILSSVAYGGNPSKLLQKPFLMACPSTTKQINNKSLPKGLTYFELPGHCQDMIGIKTDDEVYFMADAIIGENILEKYKIQFTYDVSKSIVTLNNLKNYKGKYYVPSHGEISKDINSLVDSNLNNTYFMIDLIKSICKKPKTFDEIIKKIFDIFHIKMTTIQYHTISTTIKCYLTYMLDNDLVKNEIEENFSKWSV